MDSKPLQHILFFDVETVSVVENYEQLSERMQQLWNKKHRYVSLNDKEKPDESFTRCAAIYAEFGRVICISCGIIRDETLRVKSFSGGDEKSLLEGFGNLLNKSFSNPFNNFLCGHNIKEFDVPYVCRRMRINGLKLPDILDIPAKNLGK